MTTTSSPTRRKILLITNIDRGETNVFVATTRALLEQDPNVEIHFATFSGLEAELAAISQEVCLAHPTACPIAYHSIRGLTMADGMRRYLRDQDVRRKGEYLPESFVKTLRFRVTRRAIRDSVPILVPYSGPQMEEIFLSIVEIIKDVAADLVVLNSLMTPALTACYFMQTHFVCLSPNSLKEFSAVGQPHLASVWKFPALFSGYSFPVPIHLRPANIYFNLYAAKNFIFDKHRRDTAKYLKAQTGATLRTPIDLLRNPPPNFKVLVSSLPQLDFPLVVPPHVFPCGPIVRQAPPIADADPELASWLCRAPTVYINLGSICLVAEEQASQMAIALKVALDMSQKEGCGQLQILWKLRRFGEYDPFDQGSRIYSILGQDIQEDRVRIMDWILPEPISILQSGNIACSMHHGGANSYNEAVVAGVPQLILPQWTDCYDYAQRVEILGIGRCGSRRTKPQWFAKELTAKLLECLLGDTSDTIKKNAKALASVCQANGSGAIAAARHLLGELNGDGGGGVDTTVWQEKHRA